MSADNYRAAVNVAKVFDIAIKEANNEATMGSRKASVKFMQLLTDKNIAIRALGYYHSDNGKILNRSSKAGKKEILRVLTEMSRFKKSISK